MIPSLSGQMDLSPRLVSSSPLDGVNRLLFLGGFVALWQVQSKLAALTLLGLVAFSVWIAVGVMLIWTVLATIAYYAARRKGAPDLLENQGPNLNRAVRTGTFVGRAWLVGLNALVFVNLARPILVDRNQSRWSTLRRGAVVAAGLTLFGATTSQHILHHAGYREGHLLTLSLLGALINVPFRVFCGALTLHLLLDLINLVMTPRYI